VSRAGQRGGAQLGDDHSEVLGLLLDVPDRLSHGLMGLVDIALAHLNRMITDLAAFSTRFSSRSTMGPERVTQPRSTTTWTFGKTAPVESDRKAFVMPKVQGEIRQVLVPVLVNELAVHGDGRTGGDEGFAGLAGCGQAHREVGHRLSRARLADDAQRLAAREIERHAVDRFDHAVVFGEVRAKISNGQEHREPVSLSQLFRI